MSIRKKLTGKFLEKFFKLTNSFSFGKLMIYLAGFFSLLWFLIRVIPKPSRAMYPCQRVAFPLASAFVIWLTGFTGSYLSFKKARNYLKNAKYIPAFSFFVLALLIFGVIQFTTLLKPAEATTTFQQSFDLVDNTADSAMVKPKAVVAIVRSDKPKAEDIDSAGICDMVRKAVELAGGFDSLVHDSMVVVLKPNLIAVAQLDDNFYPTAKLLPKEINAVTTDYRVIQAVVNLVRERNPHGKIYIMEGSGIGQTRDNMQKMGWLTIKGVDDFICLDEACGAWRDTKAPELVKVSLPDGKALYSAAQNIYYLNKIYYDADAVISIPVLKNHSNAAVTGAVKNVGIGATPINIYGASDSRHWRVDRITHDGINFSNLHNWIHDFYMCRPVDYAIMDALTGMEDGPTPVISDPVSLRKKNTRCIIAGKDPVALDAIESLIVQVDPSKVRYLATLHNDSIGCADPKYIRVKGIRVDEVKEHYSNLVTYANYYNFSAPALSVDAYTINDSSFSVQLNADPGTVKIEIAINDTLLDYIFTKNFNDLTVKTKKRITNPRQVKIYAYDHYLNCSIVFLDGSWTSVKETKARSFMKAYPNPFTDNLTLECDRPLNNNARLYIYDISGKVVAMINPVVYSGKISNLNLSDLPKGHYHLVLKSDQYAGQIQIVKN